MEIQTFKPDKYRDCPVYYRNFKDHFEYLAIINNELYSTHIRVRPYWITKLLCAIDIQAGMNKMPYSPTHLKNILKNLRAMAEATIDFILDKKGDIVANSGGEPN